MPIPVINPIKTPQNTPVKSNLREFFIQSKDMLLYHPTSHLKHYPLTENKVTTNNSVFTLHNHTK